MRTTVGDIITFKATLELPRDAETKSFVFGKRPTNCTIDGHRELGEEEVSALD